MRVYKLLWIFLFLCNAYASDFRTVHVTAEYPPQNTHITTHAINAGNASYRKSATHKKQLDPGNLRYTFSHTTDLKMQTVTVRIGRREYIFTVGNAHITQPKKIQVIFTPPILCCGPLAQPTLKELVITDYKRCTHRWHKDQAESKVIEEASQ